MGFPSQKIVSNGSRLLLAKVPPGGNTPLEYEISVETAATTGATSVDLSSDLAVELQHDTILDFGGTKTATINLPDTSGLNDIIAIATTATPVPVLPLTTALATTDVTTVYAMRELLGITDCSPPMQPQTVDGTDMRTGFSQANVVVGINRSVNVTYFRVKGDRAMYEIVMPYLTSDEEVQELLWAKAIFPNGDILEGACRITDGGATNQVRNLLGGNLTFNFEGATFRYSNPTEAALFA